MGLVLRTIALLLVLAGLLLPACSGEAGVGVLEGRVTIGPLRPVERPGEKIPLPPDIFRDRRVMVYDERGDKLVKQVEIMPREYDGFYRVELAPGTYTINTNRTGVGGAKGLPQRVTIRAGETARLDIDIDTGIR